jgi:hypothetical protein
MTCFQCIACDGIGSLLGGPCPLCDGAKTFVDEFCVGTQKNDIIANGSIRNKDVEEHGEMLQTVSLCRDGSIALRCDGRSSKIEAAYNDVFLGSVKDVLFTQWSINDTFSVPKGSSVVAFINDLQTGRLVAEHVTPIDVAFKYGNWWSTSNRRLFIFKHVDFLAPIRLRPWDAEFEGKWKNGIWNRNITKGLQVAVRQRSDSVFPMSSLIDYRNSTLNVSTADVHQNATKIDVELESTISTDDGDYDEVEDYDYDEYDETYWVGQGCKDNKGKSRR